MEDVCTQCQQVLDPKSPAFVWRDQPVCGACLRRLRSGKTPGALVAIDEPKVPEFMVMRMLSVLLALAGAVSILAGIASIAAATGQEAFHAESAYAGGACITAGFFQFVSAAVLDCLRAMAINSFHIRREISEISARDA